jgi:hypothetical protein
MKSHYVLCVKNKGYNASLEVRKLYRHIPDKIAEMHHRIRIIDESGGDYLYPGEFFMKLQIPQPIEKALAGAA